MAGGALDWEGQTVLDRGGEKIGTIEEIYLVEETGAPEWALVKLGRLKGHTTLVPLSSAYRVPKGVKLRYAKEQVSDAPKVKPDDEPSEQEVVAIYRHYGIAVPAGDGSNGAAAAQRTPPPTAPTAATYTASAPAGSGGSGDLRDAPIGEVISQVKEQGATLVGQELKLAKAEIGEKAKQVGLGAGMFGGAGYVANLAAIALMLCLIFALATAMQAWLAALIVTVVLGVVAGVLAMAAKKRIQQAGPPVPQQTVESVKQTIETVKEEAKWGLGQTR